MTDNNKLNQAILDSLPHWAMLIDVKNRTILSANKLAIDGGAKIDCQCWDDFGHRQFISEEHKKLIQVDPERKRDNEIKCDFCQADEAMQSLIPTRKEVEIEGSIWDTWWVPVGETTCLHYAMDITDIREAEKVKIKTAQYESMFKTIAAVCHSINQPMQVLTSALDMIEEDIKHDLIPDAMESSNEIGNITRKLQGICKYQTKEHIDGSEILDIDGSTK